MKYVQLSFVSLLLIVPLTAQAGSIVLDGEFYEGVLVSESSSRYYVQFPEDGTVRSVLKTKVEPGDVSLTESDAERTRLRRIWRASRDTSRKSQSLGPIDATPDVNFNVDDDRVAAPSVEVTSAVPRDAGASLPAPTRSLASASIAPAPFRETPATLGGEIVTDGMVSYVNLRDVPLREALKAILLPLNLDYSVQPGFIWVSTAEKIRTETFENLETRSYGLKNAGTETLFKIVLSNPGGQEP